MNTSIIADVLVFYAGQVIYCVDVRGGCQCSKFGGTNDFKSLTKRPNRSSTMRVTKVYTSKGMSVVASVLSGSVRL